MHFIYDFRQQFDVRQPRSFVAWPPPGFVPSAVVWGRWSFSLPRSDLSMAGVTVSDDAGLVPTEIIHRGRSLVWAMAGDTDSTLLPAPSNGDRCYVVTVSDVTIAGETQAPFEYPVCVIDPEAPAGPSVALTSSSPDNVNGEFDVEITFSEPVTGFGQHEVFVINGDVAALSGRAHRYEATIVPRGGGDIVVMVGSGAIHDERGLPNSPSTPLVRKTDIGRPTVEITSTAPSVVRGAFEVQIAFSEPVIESQRRDPYFRDLTDLLSVTNGSVLKVSCEYELEIQECTAWTIPHDVGSVSVSVEAGMVQNRGDQPNRASKPLTRESAVSFEGPPSVSLSSSAPPVVTGNFGVTITFSEPVFPPSDLVEHLSIVNGQALWGGCEFPQALPTVTECFVAIGPDDYGDVVVTLDAMTVRDAEGESNKASEPLTRESAISNTGPPTVSLSSSAPPVVTDSFEVVISSNRPVAGLDSWCEGPAGDETECPLRVLNGLVQDLICDARPEFRTCTLTILPDSIGEVTVTVSPGAVRDRDGETNTASVSLTRESQAARPTVVISSDAPEVVTGSFDIRVTFSEAVSGFGQDDIRVINGTVTSLSGSGSEYTATVMVTIDHPDLPVVLVTIRDGAARDRLNRPNRESATFQRLLTERPRRN